MGRFNGKDIEAKCERLHLQQCTNYDLPSFGTEKKKKNSLA